MGLSRYNVGALLVDQFRFLRHAGTGKAEVLTRIVLLVVPIGLGVLSYELGWTLQSVSELSAALGLMAGVFISAFAIVFSLRLSLSVRPTSNMKQRASRLMDESALTLLAAGLLAGVDGVWITVVSAITVPGKAIGVWESAVTTAISALAVLYFLLAIRRLHMLYVDAFPPFWKVVAAAGGASTATDIETAAKIADIAESLDKRAPESSRQRSE